MSFLVISQHNFLMNSSYISFNLAHDVRAVLIDDGIDLLDAIEIRLVVRVFDALLAPWNVGQLNGGQRRTHAIYKR